MYSVLLGGHLLSGFLCQNWVGRKPSAGLWPSGWVLVSIKFTTGRVFLWPRSTVACRWGCNRGTSCVKCWVSRQWWWWGVKRKTHPALLKSLRLSISIGFHLTGSSLTGCHTSFKPSTLAAWTDHQLIRLLLFLFFPVTWWRTRSAPWREERSMSWRSWRDCETFRQAPAHFPVWVFSVKASQCSFVHSDVSTRTVSARFQSCYSRRTKP